MNANDGEETTVRKIARACLVLPALITLSTPDARAQSFEGKTIRMVINFGAGGPLDGFFRPFIPYFEENLPGRPTIIMEHRPGATGRIGSTYLYNIAKPDGLTIGTMVSIVHDAMFGSNSKIEASRFTWLGAAPQTQITIVRRDLGVRHVADLAKLGRPVVVASTGANSSNYVASALGLSLLSIPLKNVPGYQGQAAQLHALRIGEAAMTDVGTSFYLPARDTWQREGIVMALLQRGELQLDGSLRRSLLLPDIPALPEVLEQTNPAAFKSVEFAAYRMLVGASALQFSVIAPPGMEPAIATVWRKAVATAMRDPRAIADVKKKLNLDYVFHDGEAATGILARLEADAHANPEARALIARMMETK